MKCCVACGQTKALTDYSPDARASDGRQSRCRTCASASRRMAYAENPDHYRERQRRYNAENPEIARQINARARVKHADKIRASKRAQYERKRDRPEFIAKLRQRTREIAAEKRDYDRAYRQRRAAELAEIKKAWRAENANKVRHIRSSYKARRRAACVGGDTTRAIFEWAVAEPKVCRWCAVVCEDDYHIDHVRPLARGGSHTISNLAIACPSCNLRKNAMDPETFAARLAAS